MKKIILFTYFWLVVIFITSFVFFYKNIIFSDYNKNYLNNFYQNSQWRIPNSLRVIGDSDLYKVAGTAIINSSKTFEINPEVPILGKAIIGLSIALFGKPYILNVGLYLLGIFIFYKILRLKLTRFASFVYASIFATLKIFYIQVALTMLELPQITALLLHVYFVLKITRSRHLSRIYAVFAGLSLGFYISTKFGLFAIAIVLADYYLLKTVKKSSAILKMVTICGLALSVFVLQYAKFLLYEGSLLQLLKNIKWMIAFYKTTITPNFFVALLTLITGYYRGWFVDAKFEYIADFSPIWTFLTMYFVYAYLNNEPFLKLCSNFFKKIYVNSFANYLKYYSKKFTYSTQTDTFTNYFAILAGGIIAINCVILFFTRYLLNVVPILLLFFAYTFAGNFRRLLVIASLSIAWGVYSMYEGPNAAILSMQNNVNARLYRELYYGFESAKINTADYETFNKINFLNDQKIGLVSRVINCQMPQFIAKFKQDVNVSCEVKTLADVGSFTFTTKIAFTRHGFEWKIKKDTFELLPDFKNIKYIYHDYQYAKPGSLIYTSGTKLTDVEYKPFIYLTRSKVTNRERLYAQILEYCNQKEFEVDWQQNVISPIDFPILLKKPPDKYTVQDIALANLDPALSYTSLPVPYMHPSVAKYNQQGVLLGLLQKYKNKIDAKDGGVLELTYKDGKTLKLVDTKSAPGQDVYLKRGEINIPE